MEHQPIKNDDDYDYNNDDTKMEPSKDKTTSIASVDALPLSEWQGQSQVWNEKQEGWLNRKTRDGGSSDKVNSAAAAMAIPVQLDGNSAPTLHECERERERRKQIIDQQRLRLRLRLAHNGDIKSKNTIGHDAGIPHFAKTKTVYELDSLTITQKDGIKVPPDKVNNTTKHGAAIPFSADSKKPVHESDSVTQEDGIKVHHDKLRALLMTNLITVIIIVVSVVMSKDRTQPTTPTTRTRNCILTNAA